MANREVQHALRLVHHRRRERMLRPRRRQRRSQHERRVATNGVRELQRGRVQGDERLV